MPEPKTGNYGFYFDSICNFFLLVVVLNYLITVKFRWIWLLLSSLFFYTYNNPANILAVGFIALITFIQQNKLKMQQLLKLHFVFIYLLSS